MFKEYEEFRQLQSSLENKKDELEKDLAKTEADHRAAADKYRKMMVDDASGTAQHDNDSLANAKIEVDKLAVKIEVIQEKLQLVSDGAPEKLQAMLESVKAGHKRETAKLNDEIDAIFESARELRAKLTIEIQKASAKYNQAVELRKALNNAERAVGNDYRNQTTHLGIPERPRLTEYRGSSSYVTDTCVIPREDELEKAYRTGQLPSWIEYYAQTGELLTDEQVRERTANPSAATSTVATKAKGLLGKVIGR